ncbi:hypothetical protein Lesp02_34420 [Lentzea sp. NBRC 105346]|nr:hypothetical protein Lesp02_34420 [Lentzea sp. NBRC 105346]
MYRTEELTRALEIRDLTDPAQGHHAIQLIIEAITERLTKPVEIVRRHPLVPVEHNYEHLGYPRNAITRDARYTRYVSETCMLRSHTSAMIPPALQQTTDDVTLVCPGMVYRRDTVDRLHTGTPHQLDVWQISRTPQNIRTLVKTIVEAALPGAEYRLTPREHPYTDQGWQVDVKQADRWVEIGECGIAARHVLDRAGVDRHGLASGWGLDRLLMLRKGIPDIRLLRTTDDQMHDLSPYRPISRHPRMIRDISIATDPEADLETLGDVIRDTDTGNTVEEIEILSETPVADLPDHVVERLKAMPGQKNVLLRLTLRAPTRTLTDEEANEIRDRIYESLRATPA